MAEPHNFNPMTNSHPQCPKLYMLCFKKCLAALGCPHTDMGINASYEKKKKKKKKKKKNLTAHRSKLFVVFA